MTGRYFEDIKVDDELEPLERMPSEDTAIDFFGRGNPTNPAFADAEAGRRQGFGGALVPGLLKISWMAEYAGRWAGPEASVKSIRVAFRRPDIAGKPLVLAGRVVDKRQEDGRNVVELEVVTLADGQPSVRGNIQVEVPSRG
ncbi:MAG: MaoC family dehydratase [Thermoflexaceae bacterium]|nr:MaoC family dehydratase [Thermoflexaceae bacterium]